MITYKNLSGVEHRLTAAKRLRYASTKLPPATSFSRNPVRQIEGENMKVKYQCWKCKKENEFETNEAPSYLMEMKVPPSKPTVYIDVCNHCGAQNKVEKEY